MIDGERNNDKRRKQVKIGKEFLKNEERDKNNMMSTLLLTWKTTKTLKKKANLEMRERGRKNERQKKKVLEKREKKTHQPSHLSLLSRKKARKKERKKPTALRGPPSFSCI